MAKAKKLEIQFSEELDKIAATIDNDAFRDSCEHSCTNGYDNDGSTGREIFDNGFELAAYAASEGKPVFEITHPDTDNASTFWVGTEQELKEMLTELAKERPKKDSEGEDGEEE